MPPSNTTGSVPPQASIPRRPTLRSPTSARKERGSCRCAHRSPPGSTAAPAIPPTHGADDECMRSEVRFLWGHKAPNGLARDLGARLTRNAPKGRSVAAVQTKGSHLCHCQAPGACAGAAAISMSALPPPRLGDCRSSDRVRRGNSHHYVTDTEPW
jgi:hypothetical protein